MEAFRKCSYIILSVWMMNCVCLQDSGSSSLWGNKVDFMDPRCSFWQLNPGCAVPALEEVTVCVNVWKQIDSPHWTAFVYTQRGEDKIELGLMGTAGSLKVYLFGWFWSTPYNLPRRVWHTLCLTWSGLLHRLRLYVNNTRVLNAPLHLLEPGRPRHLYPGGVLTLGMSHGFIDRKVEVETGTRFEGAVSLFRMWGREHSLSQLSDLSCIEGDVVHWNSHDWNISGCRPIPDAGLKCAWSFFEIQVVVIITRLDGMTTNAKAAKVIVNNWLSETLPRNISVYSVSLSFSSQLNFWDSTDIKNREEGQKRKELRISPVRSFFDCLVPVRVIPDADVSEVQAEIFQLLSLQYTSSLLTVTTKASSIIVHPVEAFPSVTVTPSSTMDATSPSSLTTSMVSEYLPSSSGSPILGPTHIVPSITQEPIPGPRDTFYRVNLNATLSSGTAHDPAMIIQIWILTALPGNCIQVLNFKLLTKTQSQMEFKTPQVENTLMLTRMNSYGCTFQVQANTSADVAQTEQLIRDLLKPEFSIGSISMRAQSIQISHIEPGTCPQHSQQTRKGFYMWPETKAECTASLPCELDYNQTASRDCKLDDLTERAKWTAPDLRSCRLIVTSILDLNDIAVSQNNSVDVVDMILNLTCRHTILSQPELGIVLNKLSEVLEVSHVTQSLGEAMVQVIADILESDTNLFPVTNEILNITEDIGDQMSFSGELCNLITPPLAISLVNIDPDRFDGITFGVSSAPQDLEMFINGDPIKATVAFVSLPREVSNGFPQQNKTSLRIQFHLYRALQLFKDTHNKRELNTYVVSASVTNATIRDLEQQVIVTLRHLNPVSPNDKVECVFWNFSKNGVGGWDTSGCLKHKTSQDYTTCVCDHLTHFGVLLDVSRTPVSEENERILTIISYLGCGISSVFLGVSLLTYTVFEKLRRDYPSKILINLSLALLGLNLVFLVDSWLSSFNCYGLCISTAASLHYFLLASFTWMGLEAVHMYFALVKVFNVYVPSYIPKFCMLGWGIPLLVVSLILAVKMDVYGSSAHGRALKPLESTEQFCWLQDDVAFYVSVVAYILLVLLFNIAVFVVVLVQIHKMRANKPASSHRGLLHDLRGVASLTFLLGLTWMLAFFAWGPAKVPLLYLFALLNSLQGFFIFVFHCLIKENVRKQWRAHLCCGPFKLKEHSDWSQTATIGIKSRFNHQAHTASVKSARSDNSNSTSNSSISARRLISTRRPDQELVYEKPLALPRPCCGTAPVPPEGSSFPGETDCRIPSWPPRDKSR